MIDPATTLRYYRYDEFTTTLQQLTATHPELATLTSLGQSHRGREIWLVTLSNQATGADTAKPAFLLDANNHGEEVVTSVAAVYAIAHALASYGRDPVLTELLDTRTLYVVPRLNPDGAEISLTSPYRTVGNGHYLPWEEQLSGLHREDLDGDGRIAQMRIPDPNGEWKIAEHDPQLMVLREPGELGGSYYRLLPEGTMRDWDGVTLPIMAPRHGNLNRQFPANWAPEHSEYGAGDLPLNEPEAAALARFVLEHPNIVGVHSYHSHGNVLLRPSGYRRDIELPAEDVDLFKTIGQVGTRLTGYPVISTYEDFTESRRSPRHGTFTDWAYEQFGMLAFAPELWDVERAVGIQKEAFFSVRSRSETEQQQLMAWIAQHIPAAIIAWRPYEHPQFGSIEIGGIDAMFVYRNPPEHLLADVARPIAQFSLQHAAASPLLRVTCAQAEALGHGFYKITAAIENQGYLPTYVSRQALETGVAIAPQVTLETGEGVELLMGAAVQAINHLAGRVTRRTLWDPWRQPWGESATKLEWLVRSKANIAARLAITVSSDRGGSHRVDVTL